MRCVLMFAGVLGAGVLAACGTKVGGGNGGGDSDNPSACPNNPDQSQDGSSCSEVGVACSYVAELCFCAWGSDSGPCKGAIETLLCVEDHAWSYATSLSDCSCPKTPPTPGTPCTTPMSGGVEIRSCGYDGGCSFVESVYECHDGVWVEMAPPESTALPCPPPPAPW